jgi:bacterioferritin
VNEEIMFEQQVVPENFFLKDVLALRASAGDIMARQAPDAAAALLQTVLTAEIICVLRYTMISVSHDGLKDEWIGAEFQEQANDERRHMKMAAARIAQLGGTPDFDPPRLASRFAALTFNHGDIVKRVAENLEAEQCVIKHYQDLINYLAKTDPQTCLLLQDIIRDEQDHTSDMQDLLGSYRH